MDRVYLIGGSGFIGKNLVEYLSRQYQITVVDKYIDEFFFKRYPLVETLKIDLVKELIPESYATPDYMINLASIVTAERDFSLFDGLISSNLKVLLNLYERYKDDKCLKLFIQFGSSEEYGSKGSPFVESCREEPNSPYALVKQLTVNTALMLHANYNFPTMVVRPGNLFGKYQNKSKFIPYIISQLQEGNPIKVTPCEQKRDFIYASDFAWCIGELIANYQKCLGQIVNVASGESVSLKSIVETCKVIIGKNAKIHYGAIPYRENEVMDLKCSVDKLSKIIGKQINFNMGKRLKEYINQ